MTRLDISPFARVIARVDRAHDGDPDTNVVPTGFPSLDRALGGGFRRGNLVVLGGDDGVGTSSLALSVALRQATPAVLLTSEMHADRIFERALAAAARVALDALRLGAISDEERVRLAAAALSLRDQAPVVDVLGADGMAKVARAADGASGCSLVVVDGLESLLQHDGSRDEALAFLLLSLKRLALDAQVVILVTSHLPRLDRSRQDRRPRLQDFGAAGAVGLTADLVLGLFREDLYEVDLGVTGATELSLLKHRDGAIGYVDLYHDARYLRFEDVLDPAR
jgi:replicative DNA helicase